MAGQRITKVSHKNGDFHVRTEEESNGDVIKKDIESDTPANPEFTDALTDIGLYLCKMMEFPKEWTDKHECRSVTINYEEDDRMGVVVSLYVTLAKFSAGISINSPHLREKLAGTPGGGAFMPPKLVELVQEVIAQGQKYMDGDRAQRELLEDNKSGDKADK